MIAESEERIAESQDATLTRVEFAQRTFRLGIRVVRLVEALPAEEIARTIGEQLLRCGMFVGANYRAASRARSKADFISKMGIVEEECDETIYWIEMLQELQLIDPVRVKPLLTEANELLSIAVSSIRTARQNAKTL